MNADADSSYPLQHTNDFEAMRSLALRAGLEDGNFDGVVTAFGCFRDGALIGCAALKCSDNTYTVEWLAVDEPYRGSGIGKAMVDRVAVEAKSRGARQLWALARAPAFFERIGFRISPPEASPGPTFVGCLKCAQYGVRCFPKIVVRDL